MGLNLDDILISPDAAAQEPADEGATELVYHPAPADLSAVTLDPAIQSLIPILARQLHEEWANARHKQGKTANPHFKDFEKLSGDDKQENITNAELAIKILLTHQFRIKAPDVQGNRLTEPESVALGAFEARLKSGSVVDRAELSQEWRKWEANHWRWALNPGMYLLMARQLILAGEADEAHDVATEGLKVLGGNVELLRWQALALVNTGAARHAFELLDSEISKANAVATTDRCQPDHSLNPDFDTLGFRGVAALEWAHQSTGDSRLHRELLSQAQ